MMPDIWIDGFTSVKPTHLYHRGLLSQNWTSTVETECFLVTNGLKFPPFVGRMGIKMISTIKLSLNSPCSIILSTILPPLPLFNLHIHKTDYSDVFIQTSVAAVRHHSICGDDKVTMGFISTERGRGGLPHRLKKALVSTGTMGENYHMNMTTAPRPLKTINLPTPSAMMPDNPPDIPS